MAKNNTLSNDTLENIAASDEDLRPVYDALNSAGCYELAQALEALWTDAKTEIGVRRNSLGPVSLANSGTCPTVTPERLENVIHEVTIALGAADGRDWMRNDFIGWVQQLPQPAARTYIKADSRPPRNRLN